MRVDPYPMPDLLASLNQTELEAQEAALEISTGRSVYEPSDDPTAAALLVQNDDEASLRRAISIVCRPSIAGFPPPIRP